MNARASFAIAASLLLAACAAVPPPTPTKAVETQTATAEVPSAVPFTPEATQGAFGIELAGRMAAFIFFTGPAKPYSADECAADEKCLAMLSALSRLNRLKKIQFEKIEPAESGPTIAPLDPAHDLPHRALHEIDIQGHQAGTLENPCPGQHTMYVYPSGEFLTCWGSR